MFKESSCSINQVSSHGAAGLMQLLPSTANQYRNRCGVAQLIDAAWLTNPANASVSICIAAEFIRAMAQTQCGSDPHHLAAGYNGGPAGACGISTDCAGEQSCTGGAKKRWECLYNNPQHTSCNTGPNSYEQTRNYVSSVYYCYNAPGF
jgi:soluble lytic murein transglycosylase-like protein